MRHGYKIVIGDEQKNILSALASVSKYDDLWSILASLYHSKNISHTPLAGLYEFYIANICDSAEERKIFMRNINFIANYAMATFNDLKMLKSGKPESVTLNRKDVVSLLAQSFLCLHDEDIRNSSLPHANFYGIYSSVNSYPVSSEKLKCFLHYISRLADGEYEQLDGKTLRFERVVLGDDELVTTEILKDLKKEPLCQFLIASVLEEADSSFAKVDFANRYLGGGALGRGCVQEEILFVVCPELIAGMLFCEVMADNEAIIISGYERFSQHQGYATSFKFEKDYKDEYASTNVLIAIDAIPYYTFANSQYRKEDMLREINKAYAGFKLCGNKQKQNDGKDVFAYPRSIATGNWGCGAFGGDPQLKCLLQWIAASCAGCEKFMYCTFDHPHLVALDSIVNKLQNKSVADVIELLWTYCDKKLYHKQAVFEFLEHELHVN